MTDTIFEIKFPSHIALAKQATLDCLSFISKTLKTPSLNDMQDLKLIFCELLYNAVIHGNNNNKNKNVSIFILINCNTVTVKIKDEGKGFDYKKILSSSYSDIDYLNENGRGIKLVTNLVDSFNFNDIGNEIKFVKEVAVT